MSKRVLLICFSFLALFIFTVFFYIANFSQAITPIEKTIDYSLPYPGILPDNPLYFLKAARDQILELTTRDDLKKVDMLLLFSDKRVSMAIALSKAGKNKLAVSAISKAEKYFLKIPNLILAAKKQGGSPDTNLIEKLKLSNNKHREVLEIMKRDLPQGQDTGLGQVVDLNSQIKETIDKL